MTREIVAAQARVLPGKLVVQASSGIVPMVSASLIPTGVMCRGSVRGEGHVLEAPRGLANNDRCGLLVHFLALEVSFKSVQEEAVVWYREP